MVNATWIGSPNYTSGRGGQRIDHITLHIMAGYLAGTDSTFQITSPPERRVSATYGIGRNGAVHQYVRETDTAWADADTLANQTGISIEHEGGLPQQKPVSDAEIEASARLCADISRRHGLGRLWHDGIRGNVYLHREIPGSTHTTCPDLAPNGLPYQRVIDRANQILGYTNNNGEEPEVVTDKDIDRIAKKVWETPVHGTQARDRLLGIDRAANGVLRLAQGRRRMAMAHRPRVQARRPRVQPARRGQQRHGRRARQRDQTKHVRPSRVDRQAREGTQPIQDRRAARTAAPA